MTTITASAPVQSALELSPHPDFFDARIQMFEKLLGDYKSWVAAQPRVAITVTLPDGNTRPGTAWETSPMDIAKSLSKSLADRIVIAKVNGELWDLPRPLEGDCKLELLDFESAEGKQVFWHSSAHVLGEACERRFGCHLCIGPPLEDGFYYEMAMEQSVHQGDFAPLETIAKTIIKEKQTFDRLMMSKEQLLEMFKYNKYKQYLIQNKIPDGGQATVYRCGPLIDLCRGPHIPHTGKIKAFAVMKNSSSYFLGDNKNDSLQRVYGISFPDTKQMTEYKKFLEEAAKRDHRKIGRDQELFMFHELSPGSCFFLPHGTRIYNKLVEFIRTEYRKRGYNEVITPNIYNSKLWEISGHWQNYRDDMFTFEVDKESFALKPMNCPGHCLMFGHRDRSYRELPLRMADFGVLHRNEASGALSGLTRVRRFQQDDAHIFCRHDQIEQEMTGCLEFMRAVYGIFGFEFHLKLSTRPEKFLGEVEVWNVAEKRLADALDKFGHPWTVDPGDGAFYGPKIDISITDALRRKHQCATIQLDFQLPERFDLKYRSEVSNVEGAEAGASHETGAATHGVYQRPVIIHRAMLGSVERQMAILIEHFAGKFPFWLSPRQIMIVPVAPQLYEYATNLKQRFHDAGYFVDADLSEATMNKKIRNAEIAQYNFIFVVGAEEEGADAVNVRSRDDVGTKARGEVWAVAEVLKKLAELDGTKSLLSKF